MSSFSFAVWWYWCLLRALCVSLFWTEPFWIHCWQLSCHYSTLLSSFFEEHTSLSVRAAPELSHWTNMTGSLWQNYKWFIGTTRIFGRLVYSFWETSASALRIEQHSSLNYLLCFLRWATLPLNKSVSQLNLISTESYVSTLGQIILWLYHKIAIWSYAL